MMLKIEVEINFVGLMPVKRYTGIGHLNCVFLKFSSYALFLFNHASKVSLIDCAMISGAFFEVSITKS
jgi:hypothetical protein